MNNSEITLDLNRKTKIVAKIADNKSSEEFLRSLIQAGADVFWLNTAHQGEKESIEVIERIRKVSTKIPIAIDTKGPEIRVKDLANPIELKKGDIMIITGDTSVKGDNVIYASYPNIHKEVPVNHVVLFDDASIGLKVIEKTSNSLKCEVLNSGLLKNKKSINIPNIHINLPALSEKDKGFIHFCAKNNVDFITHSFVRGKEDIFEIKKISDKYPEYKLKVISKIENREGFDNVNEILKFSEGLMVARGDLGAEVPVEELPFMQKKMVQNALKLGKFSIVATQVLDSMIKNPRPTRAEISDVGNAVLDGAGAMSMSGETAYGEYPIESTTTMGRIMKYTESKRDDLVHFGQNPEVKGGIWSTAKALSAKINKAKVNVALAIDCDLSMLKAISAYRPNKVVVAVMKDENELRETGLLYGVRGIDGDWMKILNSKLNPNDSMFIIEKKGKTYKTSIKTLKKLVK